MATMPSIDEWLREAKKDPGFRNCGMYLVHNGTVRETPKAQARGIETDGVAAGEKVGGFKATATPPNRMTSPFWLRD